MTRDEIVRRLAELRDEQLKLRLRQGTESLPNPLRLRMLRRDIAKCLTFLRQMELAERTAQPTEKKND